MDKKIINAENEEISFEELDKVSGGAYTLPDSFDLNGQMVTRDEILARYEFLKNTAGVQAAEDYLKDILEKYQRTSGGETTATRRSVRFL